MVVDDTVTYRMIMKKVAESIPGIQVISTASNGKLALDKLRSLAASKSDTIPDVLLLDVEMPVMDGLATLKELKNLYPDLAAVMVSALSRSNANIIMECLNAGALDFVTKPLEKDIDRAKAALRGELEPILSIIVREKQQAQNSAQQATAPTPEETEQPERKENRQTSPLRIRQIFKKPAPRPQIAAQSPRQQQRVPGKKSKPNKILKPDLLLIGSSTGGPAALTKVLGSLGGPLSIPTLIVQHMPPVFTASLAAQLTRTSGIQVKEAEDGLRLTPGSITIAMGGRHMVLKNDKDGLSVSLNDGPKVNECRPAVDVLFMSAMASYAGNYLAVILTGMGRDGANGVDALKRNGRTYCITQDKKSCVVYGMPRSVDEKNLSDLSIPLEEIGPTISKICS